MKVASSSKRFWLFIKQLQLEAARIAAVGFLLMISGKARVLQPGTIFFSVNNFVYSMIELDGHPISNFVNWQANLDHLCVLSSRSIYKTRVSDRSVIFFFFKLESQIVVLFCGTFTAYW